jgi:hypothetical protein
LICRLALGVAAVVVTLSRAAQAQPVRGPVLLLQPGMASADFISTEEGEPATTGFNLRFAAVQPTSHRWLTLIVGGSVTPYGSSGASRRNINTPSLFVGNVFPVLNSRRTAGWISVDAPLVLTYSFGGGGEHNDRIYGRDVSLEAAFTIHAGERLLSGFGEPLARLRIYGILDQNLTPNASLSGRTDRFNPVAFYGITIPFGTSRNSP